MPIVIQLGVDISARGGRDRELESSSMSILERPPSEQMWAEHLEIHNGDYRVWLEAQKGGFCSLEPRPQFWLKGAFGYNRPNSQKEQMDLAWYGLSCFRMKERGLATVVTDPYDPSLGLAKLSLKADLVTVSHDAAGHNYLKGVKGAAAAN